MIITQSLLTNATKNINKAATRYLGKDMSYRELLAMISRLSYLYQHEIGRNVRMAFFSRNSPTLIATFFAMTNIRATCIFVDPDAPPEEFIKWLKDFKPTHLGVSSDLANKAHEILQNERLNVQIVDIEKKHGGEYDTSFTPQPDHQPNDADIILCVRTFGTTGKPKIVNFNHKQLNHAAMCMRPHYHLLANDKFLTIMPWYHPFPFLHGMFFPIMNNSTVVVDHGLQAVEFLDFLLDNHVTRIVATPPILLKLLIICKNEKRVLPGTKSVTVGIGSLSPELKKAFDLLKVTVSHCYGMSENLWATSMQDTQEMSEYERGMVGKGLMGLKYKVMDPQGDEVEGDGKRLGQLAVSGANTMVAYLDREKDTKQAIRGTWLYTGDLVYLEGKGDDLRITFVGRKDDVFLNGDQPVSLLPLDAAMKTHPAIQDAAAFAIRNSKNHQAIVCVIVRKTGAALNEKQLMEFCQSRLPDGLAPFAVTFTDVISRDLGNNVNYSKLRHQFSGLAG